MLPKNVYISIISEITSFILFLNLNSVFGVILVMLFHGLSLGLLLLTLFRFIPERFTKENKTKTFFAIFSICFFILYFGYLALLIITVYLLRKQKNVEFRPYESFSLSDLVYEEFEFSGRKFGEGSIFAVGKTESVNKNIKERAIFSVSEIKNPLTISILKENLSSKHDDIRLYAFSVVSKMEKDFNENLHKLKNKLKDESLTEDEKAEIFYEIANQYYDFVYFKIADEEFKDFLLEEALFYGKKSLELKETPEALILIGKIYIRRNMPEIALTYFMKASKTSSLNPIKYVPYIAEIYYKSGVYTDIVELFKAYPQLRNVANPNLNFIIDFWTKGYGSINR